MATVLISTIFIRLLSNNSFRVAQIQQKRYRFINFLRLIFYNYIMWFNRNRRKISIFVGKNRIKTRPDSLTNQRLPGINATKIVFFLDTTK